jgi:hypothetical protein
VEALNQIITVKINKYLLLLGKGLILINFRW